MATYFISDLHFHHKNILTFEPMRMQALAHYVAGIINVEEQSVYQMFLTMCASGGDSLETVLEAHDEMLIEYWNSVITDDDEVWFLGDLGLCRRDKLEHLVTQLKGHKYMIYGNHDRNTSSFYQRIGFEIVSKTPVIINNHFVLSHAPLVEMSENKDKFYIFGHVHSNPIPCGTEMLNDTHGINYQCVCAERQNLKPIRIEEFDNQK